MSARGVLRLACMRSALGFGLLSCALVFGCAVPADEAADNASESSEDALVGGSRDLRWSAAGYLTRNDGEPGRVHCGATLIAPRVVVTAAHCALRAEASSWSFGVGDPGTGPRVKVLETHVHPSFRPEAQGSFDLVHALRKYDVAYLYLAQAVPNVVPAALPTEPPKMGCSIQAIGYHADQPGKPQVRKSTPACIMFRVTLGQDPIFEVHPQRSSGLCAADGDEGSPAMVRDQERAVLVGFYVGSVTQGITDCRRGVQFLNGYESAYGYRDFFAEAIAGAARL